MWVNSCPLVQRPHVSFRRMRTLPCSPAALPQEESKRDRPEFGGCFDEHVVQRGDALTLPHTSR
jgi:hypothetical protein